MKGESDLGRVSFQALREGKTFEDFKTAWEADSSAREAPADSDR